VKKNKKKMLDRLRLMLGIATLSLRAGYRSEVPGLLTVKFQ
jgi:hypothetical protein